MWFLFLVSTKGKTRDKKEFVTKFIGIIDAIIFVQNPLSDSLWNLCYTVFFHWLPKTQNRKKKTFRDPSANLYKLCAYYS